MKNENQKPLQGKSPDKEVAEAEGYRKAAENNNAEAQYGLGNCYYYGMGVAKDKHEALKWWRKAAEQNNASAQYILGFCYSNGDGVEEDCAEGVKWYRKAADQHHPLALVRLGVCYAGGEGVAKDMSEAVKWYRKAAELGRADAQYLLGFSYLNGSGVSKDDMEAYKWLTLSSWNCPDAKEKLNIVQSRMTPEQIAEASRLVREFKPTDWVSLMMASEQHPS